MNPARAALALLLLASTLAAACGDAQISTTPTTVSGSQVTEVFTGAIAPGETKTYAFTMPGSLPTRIGLGSLVDANGVPLTTPLTIGIGIPAGTGCGLLQSATVAPSLASSINLLLTAGVYCISAADAGQLQGASTFGVRITFGDPPTDATGGTATFANTVLPGGFSSRSFKASAAGTVTVIMDTIDPASVSSLGLGIGFPRTDGGGCELNQSFSAGRGSQFAVPVEAGTYCVKVSDPGTLTSPAQFSLRIIYP
jgi:hypothetical protein